MCYPYVMGSNFRSDPDQRWVYSERARQAEHVFFWIVGKILTRGLSTMMRIFSVIFEGSYKNHKQSTLG